MKGAGTQDNPYICETIDDFLALGDYSGTDAEHINYVKLTKIIDFNKSDYKTGITSQIINAQYLELYCEDSKVEVRNIVITAANTNTMYIYRMRGIKMSVSTSVSNKYENYAFIIGDYAERCAFGIFTSNANYYHTTPHFREFFKCSFHMSGENAGTFIASDKTCKFVACKFYAENLLFKIGGELVPSYIYQGGTFEYCYFIGNVKVEATADHTWLINRSTFLNCYFATSFTDSGSGSASGLGQYSCTFAGVNWIDADVYPKSTAWPLPDTVLSLTTEQSKSAEYLQNIGFPAVDGG